MHTEQVFAFGGLVDYIDGVSHDNDHFLGLEVAWFAVHRVVSLREPDAAFHAGVQLAQVPTADRPVKGLVNVDI